MTLVHADAGCRKKHPGLTHEEWEAKERQASKEKLDRTMQEWEKKNAAASKFKKVSGKMIGDTWTATCPVQTCGQVNFLDMKRSFRPLRISLLKSDSSGEKVQTFNVCEHFQQLEEPGTMSDFLFRVNQKKEKTAAEKKPKKVPESASTDTNKVIPCTLEHPHAGPHQPPKRKENIFFLDKCKQKIPTDEMLPKKRKCPECKKGSLTQTGSSWNTASYSHSGMVSTDCRYTETIYVAPSSIEYDVENVPWAQKHDELLNGTIAQKTFFGPIGPKGFVPVIWGMDGKKKIDFGKLLDEDLKVTGKIYSDHSEELRKVKEVPEKKAPGKRKPKGHYYTLKVENVDHPGNIGSKYLVDFEIRNGLKEHGFGGVGVGIRDIKKLDETVVQILQDANNIIKDHKELKPVYEELDFGISNKSEVPDEKIRAAQVKAVNDIFWKETHPEEKKKPTSEKEPKIIKLKAAKTGIAAWDEKGNPVNHEGYHTKKKCPFKNGDDDHDFFSSPGIPLIELDGTMVKGENPCEHFIRFDLETKHYIMGKKVTGPLNKKDDKDSENKSEWEGKNTVVMVPMKRKRKKKAICKDPNLVQTDLEKFFPLNQSDIFDFFEVETAQNTPNAHNTRNILILSCSQHKSKTAQEKPIDLYQGQSYKIVRKFLEENQGINLEVYTLSAKYGLINAIEANEEEPWEPYDLKLNKETSEGWKDILDRALDKDYFTNSNSFFYGSSLYYNTLPFEIPHSEGKIGEMLHQLKEWLNTLKLEVAA